MRPAESSTTCDRNASGADNGGFYDTRDDHEKLIRRPKDVQDNAIPSGSAMATHVLLKLGFLTGDTTYWDTAKQATRSVGNKEQVAPLLSVVRTGYRPLQVVAAGAETVDGTVALLANRPQVSDSGTAYVCRRFVYETPVTDPQKLAAQLKERACSRMFAS